MDIKMNEQQKKYYEESGLWTDRTLNDYWNEAVRRFGDREYIVDDFGRRYTYSEMDEKANVLASWMKKQGIKAGDMVSLQCTPRGEFVIIVYLVFITFRLKRTCDMFASLICELSDTLSSMIKKGK